MRLILERASPDQLAIALKVLHEAEINTQGGAILKADAVLLVKPEQEQKACAVLKGIGITARAG